MHYEKQTGSGRAVPDNVAFLVDLPRRTPFIRPMTHFGISDTADAEPALPGWRVAGSEGFKF